MIFENCIKKLSFEKNQMFDVFLRWLDQFVAACILIRENILLKNHLSSKTLFLAFFYQQTRKYKKFLPKHHQTVVHINVQIWATNQFNIISALSEPEDQWSCKRSPDILA